MRAQSDRANNFLFLIPYPASSMVGSDTSTHACTLKGEILSSSFQSVDLQCKCLQVLSPRTNETSHSTCSAQEQPFTVALHAIVTT